MLVIDQSACRTTSRRRFSAWGIGLIGLLLLAGCRREAPSEPQQRVVEEEKDLRFDRRYYDSIELPKRSPRTERERAIYNQLIRLDMAKPFYHNSKGELVPIPPKQPGDSDSVFEQTGDEPVVGFANEAEQLADIHRKIDSLKVLEHIPLTPH